MYNVYWIQVLFSKDTRASNYIAKYLQSSRFEVCFCALRNKSIIDFIKVPFIKSIVLVYLCCCQNSREFFERVPKKGFFSYIVQ